MLPYCNRTLEKHCRFLNRKLILGERYWSWACSNGWHEGPNVRFNECNITSQERAGGKSKTSWFCPRRPRINRKRNWFIKKSKVFRLEYLSLRDDKNSKAKVTGI